MEHVRFFAEDPEHGEPRRTCAGGPQHASGPGVLPWMGALRYRANEEPQGGEAGVRGPSGPAVPSRYHQVPDVPRQGRQSPAGHRAAVVAAFGGALQREGPGRRTHAHLHADAQQWVLLLPAGPRRLPSRHAAAAAARSAAGTSPTGPSPAGGTAVLHGKDLHNPLQAQPLPDSGHAAAHGYADGVERRPQTAPPPGRRAPFPFLPHGRPVQARPAADGAGEARCHGHLLAAEGAVRAAGHDAGVRHPGHLRHRGARQAVRRRV